MSEEKVKAHLSEAKMLQNIIEHSAVSERENSSLDECLRFTMERKIAAMAMQQGETYEKHEGRSGGISCRQGFLQLPSRVE